VSTFVSKTKETLDQKMEETKENREAHMNSLKTKLKDHVSCPLVISLGVVLGFIDTLCVFLFGEFQLEKVEKVRLTNETQLEDIRQQIDEKLRSADEKRDEIIKQLQEKLRLHVRSHFHFVSY
jgi:stathmin